MQRFEAKASDNGEELELQMFGYIGEDWYGDGSMIDARIVSKTLAANKSAKTIKIKANSGGGNVFHGVAIYSSLKNHGAKIIAEVSGLAASAMFTVVCAADEIIVNDGALMMMHEASGGTWGTASELQKESEVLKMINSEMARLYAARSGQKLEDVVQMMAVETWMTAAEAKAKGFATSISAHKTMTAEFRADQFQNVPERIKPLLAFLLPPSGGQPAQGAMTMTTNATASAALPTPPAAPPANAPQASTPVTAPAAATPATGNPAPVVTATTATDPVQAERQRCAQISAACELAGKSEMTAKYLEDPTATVASVQSALYQMVCNERKPQADTSGGAGNPPPANPNAKYEAEYKANSKEMDDMGITMEAFVQSRRFDDGLDTIKSKKAVPLQS